MITSILKMEASQCREGKQLAQAFKGQVWGTNPGSVATPHPCQSTDEAERQNSTALQEKLPASEGWWSAQHTENYMQSHFTLTQA